MKKLIALILSLTLVFALASCGGNGAASGSETGSDEVKSADLQAFYDSTFGTPSDNMPVLDVLNADLLNAFYPGLTELELKQCIVATPPMSGVPFELALVEVADAADLAKVEEIFKNRVEMQTTPPNYPPVIEAWEQYCKIVTNGNTIMMITMQGGETYVDAFNALFA